MIKRFCALILALLIASVFPASAETSFMRYTSDYFGTVSMLRLYETEGVQETWTAVKGLLEEIDRAVSVSDENSDIARFNRLKTGESVSVSTLTADVFRCALEAYELTGGLYDPTVYPLVDLWGFSPRFNTGAYRIVLPYDRPLKDGHPVPPEAAHIEALLPLVGLKGVELAETEEGCLLINIRLP